MEDGIERNTFTLDKREKFQNLNISCEKKINEYLGNYLYIYIPQNSKWEDFIITTDKEKATQLLTKDGRIEIFKKDSLGLYKPSYDCLFIDKYHY
jgi:hypothetical protein